LARSDRGRRRHRKSRLSASLWKTRPSEGVPLDQGTDFGLDQEPAYQRPDFSVSKAGLHCSRPAHTAEFPASKLPAPVQISESIVNALVSPLQACAQKGLAAARPDRTAPPAADGLRFQSSMARNEATQSTVNRGGRRGGAPSVSLQHSSSLQAPLLKQRNSTIPGSSACKWVSAQPRAW